MFLYFISLGDVCLELNFSLGYKGKLGESNALPRPGFRLGLLKGCPPRFGFHKGDALPRPGFRLGLLKERPPRFGFHKGERLLDLDFSMGYKGKYLFGPGL
ncbi:hypothetical protein C1646_671039 [Rhizophagus diaphanus]|nr:hypothetical protein C1646_671039 [Rhizophagus diaphanus] [Rhizophagus sp. MUCL 43196]